MNREMKIILFSLIILCAFSLGYYVGKNYSNKKIASIISQTGSVDNTAQDLLTISNIYGNILSLSEQKYQAALNADTAKAESLNSQINVLITKVNQLLEKYSSQINTESY
ncbi:hypothetical protein A2954_04835 [Candidatus Roizmanbacteria bacterium RIFCSPLOWO2_01_FULL_37_12]|uniref:Chemotaxis methyl-accepting receptor HlyB-like 4HB MCP domain-containing protein n=1 Tax=Candidatus Roizmanbacteria bacterium RIFCSPLOWO2_01_FULL_37_12 TaxID=1802056 RepID=A0A1F7IG19_9BACT|nr:MAG: hypothetical protein A2954_04835 [Candidatus Roizmanbacteria bacterium RIFCSPLOWO2_01_FULL_37_12]